MTLAAAHRCRSSAFLPFLQREERGVEPFDAARLRRHPHRAGNGINTAAPIGQRDSVFSGDMRDYVFKMFNIFFELVMIHCFPRITR
ncbi:hypothetical protein Bxe_B2977 [Paraburkholderia xenovorans LB400]|uniref:Uncharacterized protein n=1 Tax=Paraburkholderia xenovorans (strain LB400) TaxID=266265 RepID=Q13SC1_PARXL|nr:hypothetical protein Bxe_B2977 [Paraburkholderia xenovorans LB400]